MTVKVSIVVPIFNKEDTLVDCINSLTDQTYSNIEIILIDDGSTDNSKKIALDLSAKDNRIKVISQKNEGVSIARNAGIENSSGKFIIFVDPDDWVSATLITNLMTNSDKLTADITICGAIVENENEQIENSFFKVKKGYIDRDRAIAQLFSDIYYHDLDGPIDVGVPWAKLYKKSFLKEFNIKFSPNLRRNQDNIFNLYSFYHANKIIYFDEKLYHYSIQNFTHESSKFVSDAPQLYTNLALEFTNFVVKFYHDNALINFLLRKRLSNLFMLIFTSNLAHPNLKENFSVRAKKTKELSEKYPFNIVFDTNSNKKNGLKYRIFHFLIQNNMTRVLLVAYKIRYEVKKI